MIEICRRTVSVVYGTTANVAGAAIQNFQIGPSLSNRIGTSDSNLKASQVPSMNYRASNYCCNAELCDLVEYNACTKQF